MTNKESPERSARIDDSKYSYEDIQNCLTVLNGLVEDSVELAHLPPEQRIALLTAAGRISRPLKEELVKRHHDRRKLKRQKINDHERKVRAETGIRSARMGHVFTAPKMIENTDRADESASELIKPRNCYV